MKLTKSECYEPHVDPRAYKSFLMKYENDPDYQEGAKAYLNGKPFESPYQGNLTMWGASHHSWCSGYANAKLMVSQLEEKE